MVASEAELEELLSRPSEADVAWAGRSKGDFLVLGAGGKMGPTLVMRLSRALAAAGVKRRITAVSRFSQEKVRRQLEELGVEIAAVDLLERGAIEQLPERENVIYMAARKFGSAHDSASTWATNTVIPARVAERFRESRIVAFSTGNVYALAPARRGAPGEETPVDPLGEYAQSAVGRERLFEYYSRLYGTPVTLLRLNYAVELRYGVLVDIGWKVWQGEAVDVRMGLVNVIWQGDANSVCLRALDLASTPPRVLNVTGPETLSVRWAAQQFGELLGRAAVIEGEEEETALLSNAARCHARLGYPTVTVYQMMEWIAEWIRRGGVRWDRPTKFEVRSGRF